MEAPPCKDCKEPAKVHLCPREVEAMKLQIDAWKRYHALLSEELESAVGMAYIHGWKSTPEKIERGRKLRLELGIADSGMDAYAGDPFMEKPSRAGPIMHVHGCNVQSCDCKPVFGEKRKGETGWRGCEQCGSSEFPCSC